MNADATSTGTSAQTPGKKKAKRRVPKPLPDRYELPYRLFTGLEIAVELNVPESWVVAARKAGAPFPGGRTRPEWMLAWLEDHPEFILKGYRE